MVFSSSTVILLSAICPSLKRQLFSEGPLGGKETTGRLHFFFYPHKDVLLLPVLSFFQEVFAVRLRPFFCFPSASLRFYLSVSCLCFSPTFLLLTDSVGFPSLCPSVERLFVFLFGALLPFPFEPAENVILHAIQLI